MFHRNTRYLAGITTGLAAALLAASASAATPGAFDGTLNDDPPSITVHFQDLDLQTVEGRATLYHRMKHAAQMVCPQGDAVNLHLLKLSEDCQIAAVQRAVRSIGGATMAKLAAEHSVNLG